MTPAELTPEREQQMINEVMNAFDFKKVHRCMTLLGWGWVVDGDSNDLRVPSVSQLHKTARELLVDVSASTETEHTSQIGGFTATKGLSAEEGDEGVVYELKFTLESSRFNSEWEVA